MNKKLPLSYEELHAMMRVYMLIHPTMTAARIMTVWNKSRLFSEYLEPSLFVLEMIIQDLTPVHTEPKTKVGMCHKSGLRKVFARDGKLVGYVCAVCGKSTFYTSDQESQKGDK